MLYLVLTAKPRMHLQLQSHIHNRIHRMRYGFISESSWKPVTSLKEHVLGNVNGPTLHHWLRKQLNPAEQHSLDFCNSVSGYCVSRLHDFPEAIRSEIRCITLARYGFAGIPCFVLFSLATLCWLHVVMCNTNGITKTIVRSFHHSL